MSPWRMMNEWGIPSVPLHSFLHRYAKRLADKGEQLPALAVAGSAGLSAIVAPRRSTAACLDRAMAVGYVGLSLGMITGGVWGELAWGDYWTWSVKETWTLVTWLACTLYYHVRRRRGWRGTRALIVAVMISVTVCANLFLTPILLRWTRLQRWRIY